MNRPARFTVADLRRALRAAEHAGKDWAVEIEVDGRIRIVRQPAERGQTTPLGLPPNYVL